MKKTPTDIIDRDVIEEVYELLSYAFETRRWSDAEEALELLRETLGHESLADEDEEQPSKRNHVNLEE